MHGPTFMANPLACAVALASLELLGAGDEASPPGGFAPRLQPLAAEIGAPAPPSAGGRWIGRVGAIEGGLREGLEEAHELAGVLDVRVLGAIGVIELDHPVDIAAATAAAVERGVWLRPFRELIYAMPPYVIEREDLARVTGAMLAAARA
jgi:adenosylmethionine-8-amino-7-oxononanoate aminotransferase